MASSLLSPLARPPPPPPPPSHVGGDPAVSRIVFVASSFSSLHSSPCFLPGRCPRRLARSAPSQPAPPFPTKAGAIHCLPGVVDGE
ncbi:hypothetical protein ACP70R_031380 [Stipagrostis hirtigluma subsp. patula]